MLYVAAYAECCVVRRLQRGRGEIHTGYQIGRPCQRPSESDQSFRNATCLSISASYLRQVHVRSDRLVSSLTFINPLFALCGFGAGKVIRLDRKSVV